MKTGQSKTDTFLGLSDLTGKLANVVKTVCVHFEVCKDKMSSPSISLKTFLSSESNFLSPEIFLSIQMSFVEHEKNIHLLGYLNVRYFITIYGIYEAPFPVNYC